jgi:ABC-type transport system substrate-binding protein
MFVQGYLDSYGVTQENYSQVVSRAGSLTPEMEAKGITLRKVVDPGISYLLFNMDDPVVGGYTPQKRKLRQAISLSLDAQAFLDLFSQGNGKLAEFIIPPGLFGYDENYKNPYRRYDPSLKRAKELLAEAGYPNGIDKKTGQKLTIYFDNAGVTAAGRQYAGLLVKQVSRLGIKVESRPLRPIVWQDRVDKGQFQFISYGWLADYPDPENFVFLLYGPNKRPGPNHTNYNNPEYNKLFEQMRAMEDSLARRALIEKMRAIAVEDCPMVFMEHGEDLALNYNWLQNAKIHAIANDVTKYRRVDGPARAGAQTKWNRPIVWPLLVFIALLFVGSIPAANTVKQRRTRRLRREPSETEVKS